MTSNERTGWRDENLSLRHRKWGKACYAVDIDFLVVEYGSESPAALIEYKHYFAQRSDITHSNYKVLSKLAERARIPFCIAIYYPDVWAFNVIPVNERAMKYFNESIIYTEKQFVEILYKMKSRIIQEEIINDLNDSIPSTELKIFC